MCLNNEIKHKFTPSKNVIGIQKVFKAYKIALKLLKVLFLRHPVHRKSHAYVYLKINL